MVRFYDSSLTMNQEDWEQARWEAKALVGQTQRDDTWRPANLFDCMFWPALLFGYVYYWSFGSWRYYNWKAALICGPLVGLVVCLWVSSVARLVFKHNMPARAKLANAACLWLGLLGGWYGGDQNFGHNMINHFTYQDSVSYMDIDPAVSKGQSYMDAGQVYFKEGTSVSKNDMVSFRSRTNFCAAPIVGQPLRNQKGLLEVEMEGDAVIPQSGTVDFWAVGTDCCDQSTREFTCGQAANPRARSGMRMIREDFRPYYLLAVQEWTARMCPTSGEDNTAAGLAKAAPLICLPARHPLFFTWVEDPVEEVNNFYIKAMKDVNSHLVMFMAGNAALMCGMLWGLKQLGFK